MSKRARSTTRFAQKSPCPFCGYGLDAASNLDGGRGPSPGDVSICLRCGELLVFDEGLKPRKPTPVETIDIQRSTSWVLIGRAQAAIKEMNAKIATGELPPFEPQPTPAEPPDGGAASKQKREASDV